jgi:hypothetical protein
MTAAFTWLISFWKAARTDNTGKDDLNHNQVSTAYSRSCYQEGKFPMTTPQSAVMPTFGSGKACDYGRRETFLMESRLAYD